MAAYLAAKTEALEEQQPVAPEAAKAVSLFVCSFVCWSTCCLCGSCDKEVEMS